MLCSCAQNSFRKSNAVLCFLDTLATKFCTKKTFPKSPRTCKTGYGKAKTCIFACNVCSCYITIHTTHTTHSKEEAAPESKCVGACVLSKPFPVLFQPCTPILCQPLLTCCRVIRVQKPNLDCPKMTEGKNMYVLKRKRKSQKNGYLLQLIKKVTFT